MKIKSKETNVNILYFTTKCNLSCTYCYQHLDDKEKTSTPFDKLKQQVDLVLENEPKDKQTLFVLFGGEPTLEWDNVEKIVNYILEQKSNVYFNIETNGIKLKEEKFFNKFITFVSNKPFSIDISFDGIGNNLRIDNKGNDTTDDLLFVIEKFSTTNLNWRIRYTITEANYNYFSEDLIRLMNFVSPKRIITGEDSNNFTNEMKQSINTQKEVLLNLWKSNDIKIPICNIFCDFCDECSMTLNKKMYFKDGIIVDEVNVDDNQGLFNHFKIKE